MTITTAKFEAARAMCAALNNGRCRCRDEAHVGTCSDKVRAVGLALQTFLAHPGLRTTEKAKVNTASVRLLDYVTSRELLVRR